MRKKPILCLDFDGVLHSYISGWKGADVIPDPPVPGAIAFLYKATQDFEVYIFSSRSNQPYGIAAMRDWLTKWTYDHFDCTFAGAPTDFAQAIALLDAIRWPTEKPAAMVTLDDRAVTFTGTWPSIESLKRFQPWNKQIKPRSFFEKFADCRRQLLRG
jgi:hypothetical protein